MPRSLLDRMADIRACKDCQIIPRERFNEVRICDGCNAKERARTERLSALTLDEFIREVVNDRATLFEAQNHYESLYENYSEEMPYGTLKARDGDPYEWITERLFDEYEHLIEVEV